MIHKVCSKTKRFILYKRIEKKIKIKAQILQTAKMKIVRKYE